MKKEMIDSFKKHEKDVGSTEVQIATLTYDIGDKSQHVQEHKKDKHSKRGLIMAISRRKKLLSYLKRVSESRYKEVIAKLGLRK